MSTGRVPAEVGSVAWWDEWESRLARRRPRPDGLTIERIVAAAMDLVDRCGTEALTVRRLAEELGTGSASLYRHVSSRRELLVLLADHVLGEVAFPPADRDGRAKVEWLAAELRRVLLAHPNLLPALQVAPLLGPNARRGAEQGVTYLLEAGLDASDAVRACFVLIDFVLGTVFFDTSITGRTSLSPRERPPRRERPLAGPRGAEDVFTFGLAALLDGLPAAVNR